MDINTVDGARNTRPSFRDRIQVLFLEIDESRNGWVDLSELRKFIEDLNVHMTDDEFDQLIDVMDSNKDGLINFEEFFLYSYNLIRKTSEESEPSDNKASKRWQRLREEYTENNRQARLQIVLRQLQAMNEYEPKLRLSELLSRNKHLKELSNIQAFENKLLERYQIVEAEELSKFIAERWSSFIDFERRGSDGKLVMTSDESATDALPGHYDLVFLVMSQFKDAGNMKEPRHVVLKSAIWESKQEGQSDGRLICPDDWNGVIPVDIGTSQLLAYYGACLASDKEEKVALLQRHFSVDFNYSSNYHDNYVMNEGGGNGIERHAFHHMDCPLDDESGFFVLGKFVGEDLHLTAFKVPKMHVLYVPPNIIHSNDHLVGRWRTMLSDSTDAPIDHVIFTTKSNNNNNNAVNVTFDVSVTHFHSSSSNAYCENCKHKRNSRSKRDSLNLIPASRISSDPKRKRDSLIVNEVF